MTDRNVIRAVINLMLFMSAAAVAADSEHGSPRRIEAIYFDQGKVAKLYLYPGRTTLIDFPCEVTKAVSGPAGDVQVTLGATDKSELDVWLKSGISQPTNLTVRCAKDVFIFDVIPSRNTHQEYVEIVGNFGGAGLRMEPAKPSSAHLDPYKDKKLIASSASPLVKKQAKLEKDRAKEDGRK